MNRLDQIASRQRRSLTRDIAFALLVVIATAVPVVGVLSTSSPNSPSATSARA